MSILSTTLHRNYLSFSSSKLPSKRDELVDSRVLHIYNYGSYQRLGPERKSLHDFLLSKQTVISVVISCLVSVFKETHDKVRLFFLEINALGKLYNAKSCVRKIYSEGNYFYDLITQCSCI